MKMGRESGGGGGGRSPLDGRCTAEGKPLGRWVEVGSLTARPRLAEATMVLAGQRGAGKKGSSGKRKGATRQGGETTPKGARESRWRGQSTPVGTKQSCGVSRKAKGSLPCRKRAAAAAVVRSTTADQDSVQCLHGAPSWADRCPTRRLQTRPSSAGGDTQGAALPPG